MRFLCSRIEGAFMRRNHWMIIVAAACAIALKMLGFGFQATASETESGPLNIGSRLEMFVDNYLIDKMNGVQLVLHEPKLAGTAIVFDRPWEGKTGAYTTIIKDGGTYRMYRRGGMSDFDGSPKEVTIYAESKDGMVWTKPNLDLYEINGSKENNVILAGDPPFSHNFSPFLDANKDAPQEQRYKALAGTLDSGLVAFVSADGIHWKKMQSEPVLKGTPGEFFFDSQNVSFWSTAEERYVCYFRIGMQKRPFGPTLRSVARATSKDFIHWSKFTPLKPNLENEHLYTTQTHPYFRAPHIYIALPTRFMAERGNSTDILFMTARGGGRYSRLFKQAFIRPGLNRDNWNDRGNYAALNVVPTSPEEMSIYVDRRGGDPHYLERMTLRTDGFVSANAGHDGGELLTKPFVFQGNALKINYSTSAAGGIRVEILDQSGAPVPGFSFDECAEIVGDEIEQTVAWKNGGDVQVLAGKPIRLRFVLKDADLYSLKFE